MREEGVIVAETAQLDARRLGLGLTAIVNVDLVDESARALQLFRDKVIARGDVQQCYGVTGAADYASAATPGCVVAPRSRTQFDVTCSAPGTLVRRELNYGGWTASVGGRSAAISAYDTFFQSVRVPTGHSVVTFRFDPWWATPSLAISVLGLIILALAGMWPLGWWQRRVVTRLPTVLPMGRGPKPGG